MMMHTLLHTNLRFGVIYTDTITGTTDVGCVGEVIKHERLVDDRFFLICKGQERFRVTKLVRTKPYLVAEVSWLEDRPSGEVEDLDARANEVEMYMKDVICLWNRLDGKPEKEFQDLKRNLFPTPFSFFVGSTFEGVPREQHALLELEDTAVRLKMEKETLREYFELFDNSICCKGLQNLEVRIDTACVAKWKWPKAAYIRPQFS